MRGLPTSPPRRGSSHGSSSTTADGSNPSRPHFATTAAAHGAVPLDPDQSQLRSSLAPVASGHYDAYLTSYAEAVRSYHGPVILGFGHEMNGDWYSWGYRHTQPSTFVAAWRHIVTLFRGLGVRNVTWMWTVNIMHAGRSISRPALWWPGRKYVTWVGLDGYYYKPSWKFAPLVRADHRGHPRADPCPHTDCRDVRIAGHEPASEDRRPVCRHSPLRVARIRLVQLRPQHRLEAQLRPPPSLHSGEGLRSTGHGINLALR